MFVNICTCTCIFLLVFSVMHYNLIGNYAISPSLFLPFAFGPLPTLPIFLSFISPSSLSSLFLSLSARISIVMLLLFYFHILIYIHTWIYSWSDSELYLKFLLWISHIHVHCNCLVMFCAESRSTVPAHRLFLYRVLTPFCLSAHDTMLLSYVLHITCYTNGKQISVFYMDNKILNLESWYLFSSCISICSEHFHGRIQGYCFQPVHWDLETSSQVSSLSSQVKLS